MSRPPSQLPTPRSRLPVTGIRPSTAVKRPAPTGRSTTAAEAGKRSKLDTSSTSTSSSQRHLLRSASAPQDIGIRKTRSGSTDSDRSGPVPSRSGLMPPPATRGGLRRAASVTGLSTPAGRPGTGIRGGPMRDVTSSTVSRANKQAPTNGAAAAGRPAGKRQPWDLKGRLQDMESIIGAKSSQHEELLEQMRQTQERVARMEAEKQLLEVGVRQKEAATEEVQAEVERVQLQLRRQQQQADEERRKLDRQIADLQRELTSVTADRQQLQAQVQRQLTELAAKTEQAAALTSSLAQLTASQGVVRAQLDAAQLTVQQLTASRDHLTTTLAERDATIGDLQAKSRADESLRRRLHNEVQELRGNIRVICRVRPFLPDELPLAGSSVLNCADEKTIHAGRPGGDERRQTMTGRRREEPEIATFNFDRVFPPETKQEELFAEVSDLIQSALDGYNVCVFAYGQTGAGKTHTMEGGAAPDAQGMIPRALRQIFQARDALAQKGWQYTLEASFLEIYNETIRDLLYSGKEKPPPYEVRMVEHKPGGSKGKEVYVTNLKVVPVEAESDVPELLQLARQQRAVAATNCNEHSSRSHSVFTLRLSGTNGLTSQSCHGSLNLVDLAGSERLKESGSQGDRLTETKSINKSLSNLSNVIMALAAKQDHVPFRNSKLTHLLQHCLGGNSKTLMLVNVNPREDYLGETLNSLRFAAKVNQCHIGTATRRNK